jgi:hypothetical protein
MTDFRLPILIDLGALGLTPFWRTQTSFWTSDACRDTDASLKYSYDRLPMDQASFSLFAEQNVAVTPMTKLSTAGIKATSKQALFATRMMSSERNGQDRPSAASNGDPDKEPTEQGPQSLLRNNDTSEDVTQDLGLPFGPEVPQGPIQASQAILYKKWSVRVRVDKECLAQSFAVEVYLLKDPQATTPDEDDFAGDFSLLPRVAEFGNSNQGILNTGMSLSSLGQSYCTIDVWSECRVALSLRTVPIKKRVDESLMEVRGSALHSVPLLPFHQSYIPVHEYKGTTALSHRRARDQPDPRLAFHPALDRTKPALHFPHARSRTLVAKSKHNELS